MSRYTVKLLPRLGLNGWITCIIWAVHAESARLQAKRLAWFHDASVYSVEED